MSASTPMNVASRELCAKLYKLSKLGNPRTEDSPVAFWWEKNEQWRVSTLITKGGVPAYDLGYLLRELAAIDPSTVTRPMVELGDEPEVMGVWEARCLVYGNEPDSTQFMGQGGDTPEDALCGLFIQLFKEEIIGA